MSRGRKLITQCTATEWRDLCRAIRACVPPPEGYSWRWIWSRNVGPHDRGDCDRTPGRDGRTGTITIRVARGMSLTETRDILIHEIAHAFDRWDHHGWAGDHGDTFWIWHGRIYRRIWGTS